MPHSKLQKCDEIEILYSYPNLLFRSVVSRAINLSIAAFQCRDKPVMSPVPIPYLQFCKCSRASG